MVELNGFYNYFLHVLKPQNTESVEPYLKNVGEKLQNKNEIIIHNTIINAGWNQITDMIQGFVPHFQYCQTISLGLISNLSLLWNKYYHRDY